MSNTPRTEASVIKDIHGNEVLHDGCRIIRATEMAQMENELSEARKQCDEWDRIAHEKLSELAVQIDRANRAEHQRDTLVEALKEIQRGVNCDARSFVIADKALATVEGTSR